MRILYLLFPLFLCSCSSKYHLFQVASNDAEQAENGMFSFANEDLQVNYDFWSFGGTIWIEIINIGDENMRVDIAESYLLINGRKTPHLTQEEIVFASRESNFEPKVRVQLAPYERYTFETYPIRLNQWNFPSKMDEVAFGEENSPIKIESHLIYQTRSDFKNSKTLKNEFWTSNIERTKAREFKQKEQEYASSSHFFVFKDYTQFWVNFILAVLEISVAFASV
ncbi:MAG: hypothetical protein AAF806_25215, partial [Bacteroidota bacterium]